MQAQAVKEKDAVIGGGWRVATRSEATHAGPKSRVFLAPLGPTRFIHHLLTRSLGAYRTNFR